MTRRLTELGDTVMQQKLRETFVSAAVSAPSLLLAPFFAFFLLREGQVFTKLITRGIPNAFFERAIYMFDRVDSTARNYFAGLLKLTAIDTVMLGTGLWIVGVPNAFVIGLAAALMKWVPVVGSIAGCLLAILIAATNNPTDPSDRLRSACRVRDQPHGRQLRLHPAHGGTQHPHASTADGADGLHRRRRGRHSWPHPRIAAGRRGERDRRTVAGIVRDPRLRARHAHAKALLHNRVTADLTL